MWSAFGRLEFLDFIQNAIKYLARWEYNVFLHILRCWKSSPSRCGHLARHFQGSLIYSKLPNRFSCVSETIFCKLSIYFDPEHFEPIRAHGQVWTPNSRSAKHWPDDAQQIEQNQTDSSRYTIRPSLLASLTVSSRRALASTSELRSLCPFTMSIRSFTLSLTCQQLSFLCFPLLSLSFLYGSLRRCVPLKSSMKLPVKLNTFLMIERFTVELLARSTHTANLIVRSPGTSSHQVILVAHHAVEVF